MMQIFVHCNSSVHQATVSADQKASCFELLHQFISDHLGGFQDFYLTSRSGRIIDQSRLYSLLNDGSHSSFVDLFVNFRLRGGKGGFGSLLKSKGNKYRNRRNQDLGDCRDLSGRRLKTVKEAKAYVLLILSFIYSCD